MSSQYAVWTRMNGGRHTALVYVAICITFRSDLLHMVQILQIAYGMSWKSRKTIQKKKG